MQQHFERHPPDNVILKPWYFVLFIETRSRQKLQEHARKIADLSRDLYKRVSDLGSHFADVGQHLGKAVESYNKAVGSLESRVLVSARRFNEMGSGEDQVLPELPPAVAAPRILTSQKMLLAEDSPMSDTNTE